MPSNAFIALEQDLMELTKLRDLAIRKRAIDVLTAEIVKVAAELEDEKQKDKESDTKSELDKALNFIGLKNYAWDQDKDKVKLYISLDGIEKLDKNDIHIKVTETTFDLEVHNLKKHNYKLSVKKLDDTILPDSCKFTQKPNNLIVTMKKSREINWEDFEWKPKNNLKQKERDVPYVNPETSLMSLMKDLYTTGDDEMKRTIAQAWLNSEEENKKKK